MDLSPLARFRPLLVDGRRMNVDQIRQVRRINALCSLFIFGMDILRLKKLTRAFHLPVCKAMQKLQFKDWFEMPRGHFKSSIGTEMLPMWRTLRVREQDAEYLLKIRGEDGNLLYDHAFVHYVCKVHNPNQAWLLCSETRKLAVNLGRRIRLHYEENTDFRSVFSDLLPASIMGGHGLKGKWGDEELTINRDDRTRSEPTFTFKGAGQPLQSAHYDGGVVYDDIIGERSVKSMTEMEKRIEWFKRIPGIMFNDDRGHYGNELGIGNRWHMADIGHYVQENCPEFQFHRSGALWCNVCKENTEMDMTTFPVFPKTKTLLCICGREMVPVFPEQYDLEKLYNIWKREGDFNFSAQYGNKPAQSSDACFKTPWLAYYEFVVDEEFGEYQPWSNYQKVIIRHRGEFEPTADGSAGIEDQQISKLQKYIIVDPSHGSTSRHACRAAITVTGVSPYNRKYLLDLWAEVCTQEQFMEALNDIAERWDIPIAFVEGMAGQTTLGKWINDRNTFLGKRLRVFPIVPRREKGQRALVQSSVTPVTDQKTARILSLQGTFQAREFFCRPTQTKFLEEYKHFTNPWTMGTFVDILDALSYGIQLWVPPMNPEAAMKALVRNAMLIEGRSAETGY